MDENRTYACSTTNLKVPVAGLILKISHFVKMSIYPQIALFVSRGILLPIKVVLLVLYLLLAVFE